MIRTVRTQQNYGANSNTPVAVFSNNDNAPRTLIGIIIGDNTAQVHTQVQINGQTIADIDHAAFSRMTAPFPMDQVYPVGQQFELVLINGTVGAVNNVGITLIYQVNG